MELLQEKALHLKRRGQLVALSGTSRKEMETSIVTLHDGKMILEGEHFGSEIAAWRSLIWVCIAVRGASIISIEYEM